jgi:L-ribulose-5-phosphate 3-epimerase
MYDLASTSKATFITDEYSQDYLECISFAQSRGIETVEIRSVNNLGVEFFSDNLGKELAQISADNGIKVLGLDTFCFKHQYDAEQNMKSLEGLDRTADLGCRLGASWLRVFAFWSNGSPDLPIIADTIRTAVDRVGDRPLKVLIENGTFSAVGSGGRLAALLEQIDCVSVGALWDPANLVNGGWQESPSAGLSSLRKYIQHVHVKNPHVGDPGSIMYGPLVGGVIDWRKHILDLIANRYQGYFSLETHWRTERSLRGRGDLDFPEGTKFSEGGQGATAQCLDELLAMLSTSID